MNNQMILNYKELVCFFQHYKNRIYIEYTVKHTDSINRCWIGINKKNRICYWTNPSEIGDEYDEKEFPHYMWLSDFIAKLNEALRANPISLAFAKL